MAVHNWCIYDVYCDYIVIVCGTSTSRLLDLAVSPLELLKRGSTLKINSAYYILKCINPALDRVLGLVGVNVGEWYLSMRRSRPPIRHINYDDYNTPTPSDVNGKSGMITTTNMMIQKSSKFKQQSMDRFTIQGVCINCGSDSIQSLCQPCRQSSHTQAADTYLSLKIKLNTVNESALRAQDICRKCSTYTQLSEPFRGGLVVGEDCCEALGCEVMYTRWRMVLQIEDLELALAELTF